MPRSLLVASESKSSQTRAIWPCLTHVCANKCAFAKFWLAVLTEIKNRGTNDVCIVVCDGLPGLAEVVTTVWERAVVQTFAITFDGLIIPTSR
jgi:Transposase, Mutator family